MQSIGLSKIVNCFSNIFFVKKCFLKASRELEILPSVIAATAPLCLQTYSISSAPSDEFCKTGIAPILMIPKKLIMNSELSDVSKYSPIKQITTANHIDPWRFFLSIILKIKGTIGTYKAVIKAALETSVKSKAYCWIVAPTPSAKPVVIIKIKDN